MADNRFTVPLDELDAVHVPGEELVAQQEPALRWADGGGPAYLGGDVADGGADGD